MVRGTGEVNPLYGTAHEFFGDNMESSSWLSKGEKGSVKEYVDQIHEYINVTSVPQGTKNFGIVPLDEDITQKQGVKIIGVDCG